MNPAGVFREISAAVPPACRKHIVVVGSLAAGYHFFGENESKMVHTRDVDCVLEPFQNAAAVGQNIARQLLDARWQLRTKDKRPVPADENTPTEELPGLQLFPPDINPEAAGSWFLELLAVPDTASVKLDQPTRLFLKEGHFGLPTSRTLAVTAFNPLPADNLGIRYARPEMMVLSRLLEHPKIEDRLLSQPFAGRRIKRSNKDLGRVLAIGTLADLPDYGSWTRSWHEAVEICFPSDWKSVARQTGDGLRELLQSGNDLEEARHTCINGLLDFVPPLSMTPSALRVTGVKLLAEAITPLEILART